MNTLEIEISQSFGIKLFSKKFEFEDTRPSLQVLYGQNGKGKSSISRTLERWKNDLSILDEIYGDKGSCTIKFNNKPLRKTNLKNVVSMDYDQNFSYSEDSSKLLVNEKYKKRYDVVYKKITDASEMLQTSIKETSRYRIKSSVENEIAEAYTSLYGANISDFATLLKTNIEEIRQSDLALKDIRYDVISNSKVRSFLDDPKNQKVIQSYINKYEELISKTPYLSDKFNTSSAIVVAETLEKEFYFEKHGLSLRANTESNFDAPLVSKSEFLEKLNAQYQKVLNDPELLKSFYEIEKRIKNSELRAFKSELTRGKNKLAIAHMSSSRALLIAAFNSYLKINIDKVLSLISIYNENIDELSDILEQASSEITEWESVRDSFNDRFYDLPLKVEVIHKENSIAPDKKAPEIQFIFNSNKGHKILENSSKATAHLSSGEKRVMRLLYLLFDIEQLKKLSGEKVIILDDFVDSFDYKNKYRILEYINEIVSEKDFFVILLTHNFDFFRLTQLRVFGKAYRKQSHIIERRDDGITTLSNVISFDPLSYAIGMSSSSLAYWLFLIPFARNIFESIRECEEINCSVASHTYCISYKTLTESLHLLAKNHNTDTVHIILASIFSKSKNPNQKIMSVHDTYIQTAKLIAANPTKNGIDIQEKLILSVASRINAERHMSSLVPSADVKECYKKGNFTRELFKKYKMSAPQHKTTAIERVLLSTPEHIHINSFMYEPLVDLDIDEMIDIFNSTENL